ncbi:MAG TPA: GerAB/ArcD/ProY family transporter [Firmicutes bacterium]|nr:GerAB/ArcD/ProY family transporter [Bacillota bacterium]
MHTQKISGRQFIILLYICRIFTIMIYNPTHGVRYVDGWSIWEHVLSFAIGFLLLIPAFLIYKMEPEKNVLDLAASVLGKGHIVVTILYGAFLALVSIVTIVDFNYFMTNAIYPEVSSWLIVISVFLLCFYAAINGLEAIARGGFLLLIVLIVLFIALSVNAATEVEWVSLKRIIDNRPSSVFKNVFLNLSENVHLLGFLLFLPMISGNPQKHAVWYLGLTEATLALSCFLVISVFGEYAKDLSFPFYEVSGVGRLFSMKSLGAIQMMIWVFVSMFRVAFYLYATAYTTKGLFPKHAQEISLVVLGVLILGASLYMAVQVEIMEPVFSWIMDRGLLFIFVFVIPLILLIMAQIKKGGTKHAAKN